MNFNSILNLFKAKPKHNTDIFNIMYEENVPLIVLDKTQRDGKHLSHYCRKEFVEPLKTYCTEIGITYTVYESFTKVSKKYTNTYTYITLSVKGSTLSGQSFHRVLNSAKTFSGIVQTKSKFSLKKRV
ncbi:MAG: hypothetical protein ACRDD8_13330 [Bacteroidales bacterium]